MLMIYGDLDGMGRCSLVPRVHPPFHCLQYVMKRWVGLENKTM